MILSEECYSDYQSACRSGTSAKEIMRLWHRWQDQCIAEGEFHMKGKTAVDMMTGEKWTVGV